MDEWFIKLRKRIWEKQEQNEAYKQSDQSLPFEEWWCRGANDALDWVIDQMKDIYTDVELMDLKNVFKGLKR